MNIAMLVGGGPAPGINGVISAATIEAKNRGFRVFGICNGFTQFARGDLSCVQELTVADVSRIDSTGGSILGTSKTDPTQSDELLSTTLNGLRELNIDALITIGGEGTASIASYLARQAKNSFRAGHVPKTIDNDVPLPPNCPTFGFETARENAALTVRNLMIDALSTNCWYLVVTMGRKAGHLALGTGTAARAPLTLIPEEFQEYPLTPDRFSNIVVGAMLKRLAQGRRDGVVVLAEGVFEKFPKDVIDRYAHIARDPQGNIRMPDLYLHKLFTDLVKQRLAELNLDIQVRGTEIGFELRCAAPVAFDREYTLQLGHGIVELLAQGQNEIVVTRQGETIVPLPFSALSDPNTGAPIIRYVDLNSITYRAASKYMMRLTKEDLEDEELLQRFAQLTNKSAAYLKSQFSAAASSFSTYKFK